MWVKNNTQSSYNYIDKQCTLFVWFATFAKFSLSITTISTQMPLNLLTQSIMQTIMTRGPMEKNNTQRQHPHRIQFLTHRMEFRSLSVHPNSRPNARQHRIFCMKLYYMFSIYILSLHVRECTRSAVRACMCVWRFCQWLFNIPRLIRTISIGEHAN